MLLWEKCLQFRVGDQIEQRVKLSNLFCLLLQVLPPRMRFTPWGTNCFCCTTSCCMSASRGSSTRCATAGCCAKSSKPRLWRSTTLPWWAGGQLHQRLRHTGAAASVNWPGWCLLVPLNWQRSLICHLIKVGVCGVTRARVLCTVIIIVSSL